MQLHPLPTSSPSRRLRTVFLAWTHNKSETFATVVAAMSKARSISPLHLLLQQPSPGSLARKSASHPCHGRIDMADASDVHWYDQSWNDMDFTKFFVSSTSCTPHLCQGIICIIYHRINRKEVSFLGSSLGPPGFRIVARTGSANIRTWSQHRIVRQRVSPQNMPRCIIHMSTQPITSRLDHQKSTNKKRKREAISNKQSQMLLAV